VATIKWAGLASRGTVLTGSEVASLAANTIGAVGAAVIDNSVNLDRWGWIEFVPGGSAFQPLVGGTLMIYLIPSLDGTNYDEGPATTTNLAGHLEVVTIQLKNTSASTHRAMSQQAFPLPPCKFKFAVFNKSGATIPASSVINFYTSNESVA
jgi:hypothetical protein